jgi:hypothetical protein
MPRNLALAIGQVLFYTKVAGQNCGVGFYKG